MFAKVRQVAVRRHLEERIGEILAVAHKVQQLEVVITIGHPNFVEADLAKPVQPIEQPDLDVLAGMDEERAAYDLFMG